MYVFLVVFGVMLLIVVAMSIGVILGRKPISGSCGGMSALGMEVACDICGGDKNKCEKETEAAAKQSQAQAEDLAYDATRKG
ncbi:(Na+)-NQR maturation NqrM [Hahella sp. HN01]|uniref:(Na+)-NQR maturation NqrM n=1 Tax=Hahella sp. HN01 TaxID=2847262 RepID=UPI001C1EC1CC|nr:(Na+)-NQR maturation NqrM [Hahella sp. HN01]MBU6950569.1 (Na+)-NQR maturation NqrM [Hahella sp. HN01]